MKKIHIQLSVDELKTLLMLADNQLFRIKFIDPKFQGHSNNGDDLKAAQSVVGILKDAYKEAKGFISVETATAPRNGISKAK